MEAMTITQVTGDRVVINLNKVDFYRETKDGGTDFFFGPNYYIEAQESMKDINKALELRSLQRLLRSDLYQSGAP